MTRILWAIEAYRDGVWLLLPNLIMVDRRNAEWEMKCLVNENTREKYRLISYSRRPIP